jgi:hypothetical protein
MENAFTKTPSEALQQFRVTEAKGLSGQQVQTLRQKHGRNGVSHGSLIALLHMLTEGNSTAGGSPNTHMGTNTRAIQGPTGHYLARKCGRIICAGPLRGW